MKISEMTNAQAAEALTRLATPLSAIMEDKEVVETIKEYLSAKRMKGKTVMQVVGQMLPKIVSLGLQKHQRDVYEIVGALQMAPAEAVAGMNFKQTVDEMRGSVDDVLTSFFTRSGAAAKQ